MFHFKTSQLLVLIGLIAPMYSTAANYCIAVSGGFGNGGTSFVAKGFSVPAAGNCIPWSGFLKTSSNVIATSSGVGCLSSDGKVLQVSVFSSDPSFFGSSTFAADQIRLCPAGTTGCPIGGGQDVGTFMGGAKPQNCTSKLLNLPAIHN
jgi:hypothetical protein